MAVWYSSIFTSNNCFLQCYAFQPCRNQQQSLFWEPLLRGCNFQWGFFVPPSSSLLPFLFPSSHIIFVCACSFTSVQPQVSWTIPTENVSGYLSQMSVKYEHRTVGCISVSSVVLWKARPVSHWPQWSLLLFCLRLKSVRDFMKQVC